MKLYREVREPTPFSLHDWSPSEAIRPRMIYMEPIEITEHEITNILIGFYGSDRDKISKSLDAAKAILSKLKGE